MTNFVKRKCQEIDFLKPGSSQENEPKPIHECQDYSAYVLLGPPGSGKTTVFKEEATRQGGKYISARDFLTLDIILEDDETPLFIDGLDEQRAGATDQRTPFDQIRSKLDLLRKPQFRLSCREADWFGSNDTENIKKVSPDGGIKILHLVPITPPEIRHIIENFGIENPDQFITEAKQKGLQGLLSNPQNLKMLVNAVGAENKWPKNRREAFEMACESLLREHNEEHSLAQSNLSSLECLINTSGKLCAILLMTGSEGFTRKDKVPNYVDLQRIPNQGNDQGNIDYCLHSKLFICTTAGNYKPQHRQVAEFLAAKYLKKVIEQGLSVNRILSLITGYDGKVVSENRGLSAWLAAQSKPSRSEIIARDSLGTVLYGDVVNFTIQEKKQLIEYLQTETEAFPGLIRTVQLDERLGDLVTSDMENEISKILTSISDSKPDQSFLEILLEALKHGNPIPGISGHLMALIRNDQLWSSIRILAIDRFVRHQRADDDVLIQLKKLCKELYAGKIKDPKDQLLGYILSFLYPKIVSENEILDYLRVPRESFGLFRYEYFWKYELPNKSTNSQLKALLDKLVEKFVHYSEENHLKGFSSLNSPCLVSLLLAQYLEQVKDNDTVDLDSLFNWLGATEQASTMASPIKRSNNSHKIRNWLKDHPEVWKILLSMSVNECAKNIKSNDYSLLSHCIYKEKGGRLFKFENPPDFGRWCLDQATQTDNQVAAKWYIDQVVRCLHHGYSTKNLSKKIVSETLNRHELLKNLFQEEFEGPKPTSLNTDGAENIHECIERPSWHEEVKPFEKEIQQNQANPVLLYQLAQVYFGDFYDLKGDSPIERLNYILDNDENLVEAILSGFIGTLERDDLPTDKEIIKLYSNNEVHYLSLAFLAGVEEIVPRGEFNLQEYNDSILRLALAIYYTLPLTNKYRSEKQNNTTVWFNRILINRPKIVADVLERFTITTLRSRINSTHGFYELAYSESYKEVSKFVTLKILERFPVRCTSEQLKNLDLLFTAASQHCQPAQLLELVKRKLNCLSMNIAQRVYWLALGLCLAPQSFFEQLDSEVSGNERRIRYLGSAVSNRTNGFFNINSKLESRQQVEVLKLIIKIVGGSFYPYSHPKNKVVMVTIEMTTADKISDFINQLSSIPTEEASTALQDLISNENLKSWKNYLEAAFHQQLVNRREASFKYCSLEKVIETLDNKAPANVGDLAALTYDYLEEIKSKIRNSNTSDWKQYWNIDTYNRPLNPCPENSCRDKLLSDLKTKLEILGIDGQPEGNYANDKRADIRITFSSYNIPIEIKKSCHRDLWSAIKSQLIKRYTKDPGAGGYGIYLVFWFGNTDDCRPTPSLTGTMPSGPEDLKRQLITSLSAEENFKIKVCVIDVSNQNPS